MKTVKLEDYVRDKLEEIREELPEGDYLYIFNSAPPDVRKKVENRIQVIQIALKQLQQLQDDCYSI